MLVACTHVSAAHASRLFSELRAVYPRLPAELERLSQPLVERARGVSLDELERLLVAASRWSGDQALGLTLGSHDTSELYPGLGAMLQASSVRAALAVLQQVGTPLGELAYVLSTRGQRATLSCPSVYGFPALAHFHAEYVFSQVVRAMRALHPERIIALQRVRFRRKAPRLRARYAAFFLGPVRFDQGEDSLTFSSELLDLAATRRSVDHDEIEASIWQPAFAGPVSSLSPSLLSEQIRQQLQMLSSLVLVDSAEVARSLGLTQRALRRRLAAEGTSMSVLLDEERSRLSCEQLALGVSLERIVQRTGFASVPNFERAFRRWTGLTPKEYVWRLSGAARFRTPGRPEPRAQVLRVHAALRSPWESDQSSA